MVEKKGNPQEGMVYKYTIYGSDVCIVSPGEECCPGLWISFQVKVKVDLCGPRITSGVGDGDPVSVAISHIHAGDSVLGRLRTGEGSGLSSKRP